MDCMKWRKLIKDVVHCVSKKRPAFGCHNFDKRERILIFFLAEILLIK